MEYKELLEDPKFQEYLAKEGLQVKPQKEYKGKVILADNIERQLSWNFQVESFLRVMMAANGVENIDPLDNMIHFSMVVYSMLIEDMITDGCVNDKFVKYEDFVNLLPTDAKTIFSLVEVMNYIFEKSKKQFLVM